MGEAQLVVTFAVGLREQIRIEGADPSGGLGRTGCGCRSTPATAPFALVLLLCARRRRHE
jgi:uncharacterized protein (TIGR03382 family)